MTASRHSAARGDPQLQPGVVPARSYHRLDIQGLRGVAVLLVVIFHAGLPLPGGYVGVDVFFVISGFVIMGLLLRELRADDQISLGHFYARRVRRLFPALAAMSTVTIIASIFVLSPDGTQQAAVKTAAAASLSLANIQLYLSSHGYFASSADLNPFLHTWTLSVEEQFYLVLPVTVAAVGWVARRRESQRRRLLLTSVISIASLASFSMSVYFTAGRGGVQNPVDFAFFTPGPRAWEFGVGALLALGAHRLRVSPRQGAVLGIVGAIALTYSSVWFDESTAFPGYVALVPVIGALLLLIGGGAGGVAGTVLEWRPLVWIGDHSYGWYLWHWPFIVFARVIWVDNSQALWVAAIISLGPAWLSMRFVEQPLRATKSTKRRATVRLAAFCAVVPLVLAGCVFKVAESTNWGLSGVSAKGARGPCLIETGYTNWSADRCTFPTEGSRGTVLLLGDSHSAALEGAVVEASHDDHMTAAVWSRATCPLYPAPLGLGPDCGKWQAAASALIDHLRPDVVVIANRSPLYGQDDRTVRGWKDAMRSTLEQIGSVGASAIVVTTVPAYETAPAPSLLQPGGHKRQLSLAEVEKQRGAIVEAERKVATSQGAMTVDPTTALCGTKCSNVVDGTPIYFDEDHLNQYGSSKLIDQLSRAIEDSAGR